MSPTAKSNAATDNMPVPNIIMSEEEDEVDVEALEHEAEVARKLMDERMKVMKARNDKIAHWKRSTRNNMRPRRLPMKR